MNGLKIFENSDFWSEAYGKTNETSIRREAVDERGDCQ